VAEFIAYLKHSRAYWMIPIVAVLLLLAVFLSVGGSGAAPFIYTLF
jgi:hypothetical protein